jgi:hypothetical protein
MPTKSYKDYPQEFFAIIKQLERGIREITIEGEYNSLIATRHQFYRFRKAMLERVHDDAYARQKSNVIRDIVLVLKTNDVGEVVLKFTTSILTAQMANIVKDLGPEDLPPPDEPKAAKAPVRSSPSTPSIPPEPKTYDVSRLEELIKGKKD